MADQFDDLAEWGLTEADFYATPPEEWERAEEWARVSRDRHLAEAVRLDPDLLKMLELARRSRRIPGYSWRRRRSMLKPLISLYVGDTARLDALATSDHYDSATRAMDALLPLDRMDDETLLYEHTNDGVRAILLTRPNPRFPERGEYDDEHPARWGDKRAQQMADRAWIAALPITPDPVLTAPFAAGE